MHGMTAPSGLAAIAVEELEAENVEDICYTCSKAPCQWLFSNNRILFSCYKMFTNEKFEGKEFCLDKMKRHVVWCKRRAEQRQSHSDSEDEGSMDKNHIPTMDDSDHPTSNVELDKDGLEVAPAINPTYIDDINSEL